MTRVILGAAFVSLLLGCARKQEEHSPKAAVGQLPSERRYSISVTSLRTTKLAREFDADHRVEVRCKTSSEDVYIGRVDFIQPDTLLPEAVRKAMIATPGRPGEADIAVYHGRVAPEKIVAFVPKATSRQDGTLGLDCGPDQQLHLVYVAAPAQSDETSLRYEQYHVGQWKVEGARTLVAHKSRPLLFDTDLVRLGSRILIVARIESSLLKEHETGLFAFVVATDGGVEKWRVTGKVYDFRLVAPKNDMAVLMWNEPVPEGYQYKKPRACNVIAYSNGGWSDSVELSADVPLWGSRVESRGGVISLVVSDGHTSTTVDFSIALEERKHVKK